MSFSFIRFDKDSSNELKINDSDVTWMELSEAFFRFLQGSGYYVTREDIAYYWAEMSGIQYQANDDLDWYGDDSCGGGCACEGADFAQDINFDTGGYDFDAEDIVITLDDKEDAK